MDLCYGRYNDDAFDLHAAKQCREAMNRYNGCVEQVGTLNKKEVVNTDDLVGAVDTLRVPWGRSKSNADQARKKLRQPGHWQMKYQPASTTGIITNARMTATNKEDATTLDPNRQPRMPWQDVMAAKKSSEHRGWLNDDLRDVLRPPTNKIVPALLDTIARAIRADTKFHVYITLPVYSEGKLCTASTAVQVYWTMQTLVFGSNSLLNGIRRALKARELRKTDTGYARVFEPANTEYEDIEIERCFEYVTLLNLRNWVQLGDRYETEQIYVHTKTMIVDDLYALIGSANVNDRSMLGSRDSELAVLVVDIDVGHADVNGKGSHTEIRGFARKLRMDIWKKLFGVTSGVRPATELNEAIEQPGRPASWRAIQQRAQKNAELYEKAFPWVPRNWSENSDDSGRKLEASILPTWSRGSPSPPNAKWGKTGNLGSPLPFQKEFWNAPRHSPAGVASLNQIRGFITALPITWTKGENNHFPYPTSLVAGNEVPGLDKPAAPANTATPGTHMAQDAKLGARDSEVGCRMSPQRRSASSRTVKPTIAACMWGVLASSAYSAQQPRVPPYWVADCVGRVQLSLPGRPDVAANSFKMLAAEYKIGTQQPRFEFADGQQAGYSSQFYMGYVFVSQPLIPEQRLLLLKAGKDEQLRAQAYAAKTKTNESGRPLLFERLDVAPKEGYANRVNGSLDITIAIDQFVVRAVSNDRQRDDQGVRSDFSLKSSGLALRPFGELPKVPGVCFPYAFIKDDDQRLRNIGITYRLQDHPDVTIWLEDSSASAPTPEQDPNKFTADYKTNFFWTQRYQDRTTLKLLSRKTTDNLMDGRKGVATVVELVRKDGITTDYGYLAVVRGDPEAKQDTPDLMLYVIRDAKNAIDKGKQPIDKDELIKMAQTIAASVRHRPVQ